MIEKPPYTITEKAADYLAKIVETVTRLEFGTGFKHDIRLHRENRVRTIHSSLAIEGNSLSLDEVAAVIEGRVVAGRQTEVKEVKNAYEAYDRIMMFDPYAVGDFLEAHKLMTGGLVKEYGRFRNGDIGVFDGGVVVHIGARPQFVPQLVYELFEWARESELHPVLKSAILHYEIETIHPFMDGNGRIGRLWQTFLLAKWNAIFAWVPIESALYQNRPQYYKAIEHARKANDSGVFIEFTLSALLDVLSAQEKLQVELDVAVIKSPESKNLADKLPINVADKLTVAEAEFAKLLEPCLKEHEWTSNAEAREVTGKAEGSVKRFLRNLADKGVLEARGENKSRQYRLRKK
jgi:Fic family protein